MKFIYDIDIKIEINLIKMYMGRFLTQYVIQ